MAKRCAQGESKSEQFEKKNTTKKQSKKVFLPLSGLQMANSNTKILKSPKEYIKKFFISNKVERLSSTRQKSTKNNRIQNKRYF